LKRGKVGVNPWLLGVEDTSDEDPDKFVVKIRANMRGEILDTRVNFLLGTVEPRKQVNRATIFDLGINVVSKNKREKNGTLNVHTRVPAPRTNLRIADVLGWRTHTGQATERKRC
jgi:hypothetical protein